MNTQKTTTLTLRINPAFKEGLKAAAEKEHRSITNMVEVLIRDYCQRNDISISVKADTSRLQSSTAVSTK